MNIKKYRSILALFCMLLFCTNLFADENNDIPLQTIKLQLKWKHQFQFAGYYAAIEKGYYRDAGFNVILLEANETEDATDAVLKGKASFGISTSDIVLTRGKGKPVVILASIFQHSPQVIIGSKKAGINHVHDLIGKRIMIEPHSADVISYLQDEGIALNQLEVLLHSFSTNELINNKIDAITAYKTDELYILQQSNFEYSIISPLSGGIDFYGDILFTSENMLKDSPELVDKFLKASIKGWKYAMQNPEELVDIIYNKYSQRHSKEHLHFEAKEMQRYIMNNVVEIGYSNRGRWDNIIEIYTKLGFVNVGFTSEGMLYSDYLKPKTHIPWGIIGSSLGIFILIGLIASFYFGLSRKLKDKITKRKKIQNDLIKANQKISSDIKTLKITKEELIESKIILKQSEDRFRAMIENIGDVIAIIRIDGIIKYKSSNIEKRFGWKPGDLIGTNIWETLHPDDVESMQNSFAQLLENENVPYTLEYRYKCKDGTYKWISTTAINSVNNPLIKGVLMNYHDISERKKTEQSLIKNEANLKELNATKDKLFSIIAHDLRSPFNGILGFSELLITTINEFDIAKSEKYLGIINSSAKSTLVLLDNLLSWAKSQTGKINFKPIKINLQPIIAQTIEVLYPTAEFKNIELQSIQSDDIEVYADPLMLRTILRNLISNAIKFTNPKGRIAVNALQKNNFIEITVSDDGIGINDEKRNELFKLHANGTTLGTANEKGSGLGLVLCKELVEKHGGTIWVESEPNKGTTFHFTILNNNVEKVDVHKGSDSKIETETKNKPTILVVEDNETNYLYLEAVLGNSFKLIHALNGKKGVELFKSTYFDLILMDIKMPIMSGIEATKEIRKTNNKIPIIALTAYALSEDKKNALNAGCNYFLTKPVNRTELLEVINNYLAV